jgi:hypothetical protein
MGATAKGNVRFHIAMAAACLEANSASPSAAAIVAMKGKVLSPQIFEEARNIVKSEFDALGGTDAAAKSSEFLTKVRERLVARLK